MKGTFHLLVLDSSVSSPFLPVMVRSMNKGSNKSTYQNSMCLTMAIDMHPKPRPK